MSFSVKGVNGLAAVPLLVFAFPPNALPPWAPPKGDAVVFWGVPKLDPNGFCAADPNKPPPAALPVAPKPVPPTLVLEAPKGDSVVLFWVDPNKLLDWPNPELDAPNPEFAVLPEFPKTELVLVDPKPPGAAALLLDPNAEVELLAPNAEELLLAVRPNGEALFAGALPKGEAVPAAAPLKPPNPDVERLNMRFLAVGSSLEEFSMRGNFVWLGGRAKHERGGGRQVQ